MNLKEVPVYKTELVPKKIESILDGIMFFSPSAIKSFLKKKHIKQLGMFLYWEDYFCIC